MLDSITVTVAGIVVAAIALVPATLSWIEARRQRRVAEQAIPKARVSPDIAPEHPGDAVWRCGISDSLPLSAWPDMASEPTGPLVELARRIGYELGKPVKFESFSFEGFFAGRDLVPDMIAGMFETKARAERVVFSRPIYEIGLQGICRKNQQGNVFDQLQEGRLKVAVYKGEVGWEFLKEELPDVVEAHRYVEVGGGHWLDTMVHLKEGKYDVVLMDTLACTYFLSQDGNEELFKLAFEEPLHKYGSCIALNPRHGKLIDRVNLAIVKIRNSEDYLRSEKLALKGYERLIERRGLHAHQ